MARADGIRGQGTPPEPVIVVSVSVSFVGVRHRACVTRMTRSQRAQPELTTGGRLISDLESVRLDGILVLDGALDGQLASRWLTSRFRLIPCSAASVASRRCSSLGIRTLNVPE
jgi:hypothetical protein